MSNIPIETRREVESLRQKVNQYNHAYYVLSAPTIPDAEYDQLKDQLKDLEKRFPELEDPNSPTQKVGAPMLSSLEDVKHTVRMLSMEKAKTVDELIKFFDNRPVEGIIEPKIDGVSLSLRYVNGRLIQAVTRGDGTTGKDVTHNARTIRSVPNTLLKKRTLEVRGEVFFKWSAFAAYNKVQEERGEEISPNPRNLASGKMSLKDPAECALVPLDFIAYQIVGKVEGEEWVQTQRDCLDLLERLGFFTPALLPAPLKNSQAMCQSGFMLNDGAVIAEHVNQLDEARRVQDFPTDGLVFKANDLALQEELGVGTTAPNWAIAYKFAPDRTTTKVLSVEWTVGKTGKITPVANLHPVLLSGSKVARASLCNPDEVERLNVNVGDEIVLERSNEIIPKIIAVSAKHSEGYAQPPVECPACGTKISSIASMVDFYCVNPTCKAQAEAKLVYATSKNALDIEGCGPQLIAVLMKNGINTLAGLLAEKEFPWLKGAAQKTMQTGVKKAYEAPLWRKLSGLCIDGWGKQTCQEAATRWPTFGKLITALDSDQVNKTFGDVKAHELDLYLRAYAEELSLLWELQFFPEDADVTEGTLQGKSFCITGNLPGIGRDECEEEIRKRGGLTKSGVSSKLDYLVVGDNLGKQTNKLLAARRWGTTCLTPDQLFEMMAWRPPAREIIGS